MWVYRVQVRVCTSTQSRYNFRGHIVSAIKVIKSHKATFTAGSGRLGFGAVTSGWLAETSRLVWTETLHSLGLELDMQRPISRKGVGRLGLAVRLKTV